MTAGDINPADYDVIPTPIQDVQTGWSLLIKHQGHAVLFQVEKKAFSYTGQQGTVFTLESEPVQGGEPLRIQGPAGTITHRIVKKR
jgi:hypothetical protein